MPAAPLVLPLPVCLLKLKAFALDRDSLEGEILLDAGGTIGLAVPGLLRSPERRVVAPRQRGVESLHESYRCHVDVIKAILTQGYKQGEVFLEDHRSFDWANVGTRRGKGAFFF